MNDIIDYTALKDETLRECAADIEAEIHSHQREVERLRAEYREVKAERERRARKGVADQPTSIKLPDNVRYLSTLSQEERAAIGKQMREVFPVGVWVRIGNGAKRWEVTVSATDEYSLWITLRAEPSGQWNSRTQRHINLSDLSKLTRLDEVTA